MQCVNWAGFFSFSAWRLHVFLSSEKEKKTTYHEWKKKNLKCALLTSTKNIDLVQFGHASGFRRKRSPNVEFTLFRHTFFTHQLKQTVNRLSKYLWVKSLYVAYLPDSIWESNSSAVLTKTKHFVFKCDTTHSHGSVSAGFRRIPLRVYVHALPFLFPKALCEPLQLVYFIVVKLPVSRSPVPVHSQCTWVAWTAEISPLKHTLCGVSGWVVVRQTVVTSR